MKISGWLGFILATLLSAGCQSFSPQPSTTAKNPIPVSADTAVLDGKWHSVEIFPPAGLPKISTWQKFNPVWWLENADDPVPPAWYLPDDKHRAMKWRFRNPFHNFDFYVIGIADKKFVRSGRYPEATANPNRGWNFAVLRRRIIFLPFISYQRGKFEFYFGWRTRGNFGIKFNFSIANENQQPKPPK
ncbi:MAG TPA: hypothetical protein VMB22_08665 [Verrucomicrobiae bacterium]|nr:hypothetical protein [Verrucomicrobiae bacterium]